MKPTVIGIGTYDNAAGNVTTTMYVRGLESYPLMHKVSSGSERVYVYGPTGLIAYREDSTWYYAHKDHLGSVRLTATALNAKDDYYDYDPYGRTIRSSVAGNASKYLFTGQEFDTETGLYNFRARMYDTTTATFYAVDPVRQTHSPYGYALNNPVKYTDPTGMKSPDDLPEAPFPTRDSFGELEANIQAEYESKSGGGFDPRSDWDEDGMDDTKVAQAAIQRMQDASQYGITLTYEQARVAVLNYRGDWTKVLTPTQKLTLADKRPGEPRRVVRELGPRNRVSRGVNPLETIYDAYETYDAIKDPPSGLGGVLTLLVTQYSVLNAPTQTDDWLNNPIQIPLELPPAVTYFRVLSPVDATYVSPGIPWIPYALP